MQTWFSRDSLVFQSSALLVLIVVVIIVTQYPTYKKDRELKQVATNRNLALMQLMAESYVQQLTRDADVIAASPVLHMHIRDLSPEGLFALQQAFLNLADLRAGYDQLRYIDHYGVEQIRVNNRNGEPQLVTEDLQVKIHRDYVKAGLAGDAGSVFVSRFDLNIENGRIEVPFVPMVRVVASVYVDGEQSGLVVLNAKANELLQHLRAALPGDTDLVVLDDAGGWIAGGGDADWAFIDNSSSLFSVRYPALWKQVRSTQEGQFELEDECYNYRWHGYSGPRVESPELLLAQRSRGEPCSVLQMDSVEKAGIRLASGLFVTYPLLLLWRRANTRKRQMQRELAENYRQLKVVTQMSGHGLLMVDQQCRVQWINPEGERILGWTEAELIGRDLHQTCHVTPDGHSLHDGPCPTLHTLATGESSRADKERMVDKGGRILHMSLSVRAFGDPENRGAILAVADISSHIETERNLTQLASTDALTGVLNRGAWLSVITGWLEEDSATPYVIMLDIDHFKKVNDTYGHNAGDAVLKAFAQAISHLLRKDDVFGRLGGEEFALAVRHLNPEQVLALAERVRVAVGELLCTLDDGQQITITTSCGVAQYNRGDSLKQWLKKADKALYRAKHAGRNQVQYYGPATGEGSE
ncbi:diguanylate cyclase [Marinobacter segnicrescens]|uniref:sensor domain-containing diguanylate cyclase n=1 Tax=Marinobacter segnicrescens TaxID=430453 RepID=UPI003A92787F